VLAAVAVVGTHPFLLAELVVLEAAVTVQKVVLLMLRREV
tara:strand:- start:104 stop:223 length:120 start_codon:yes stop_codon:yes gene_type:complete